jgi:hypothetical protein
MDFGPANEDRDVPPGSATRIAHVHNVDEAVNQLDRDGSVLACANVLLSRDYPDGLVVPVDPHRGAHSVRFHRWEIERWNGGTFAPGTSVPLTTRGWTSAPPLTAHDDLVPDREDAPHRFMAPYPASLFKVLVACGFFLVVCLCSELNGIDERHHSEFFLFLTTCTLAMMLLVSSVELLMIYIALELSSYSLYILVPLRKGDGIDVEAGIKYFMVGATASAVMLFGLSYLYGATHTTYVENLVRILPGVITTPAAILGLVLTLCGFFFKLVD